MTARLPVPAAIGDDTPLAFAAGMDPMATGAALHDAGAGLAGLPALIERACCEAGGCLTSAVEGVGRVTYAFERLTGELDGAQVRDAGRVLADGAGALPAIADTLAEERAALDALVDMTRHVGTRAGRLGKTVAEVGVLAINARIEAAHLGADQGDFSAFTVEIGRLALSSGTAVQRFADGVGHLEALLLSAGASQAEFERSHAQRLRDAAQRLRACLEQVEAHRRRAAGAAGEIGARSRRIGAEVASCVHALQIGDITRQRVEHVAHAVSVLARVAAGDDAAPARGSPLPAAQRGMVAGVVCRLQAAQLVKATGDFEREVTALTGSLRELADDARGMARLGSDLYGAAGSRQSFLTGLTAELAVADSLIEASRVARQRVDEVALAAEEALASLAAQVEAIRTIETDMRLVGLNMAIKCGRLGADGRTLSVIAQELRAYANQTVEDAQAVKASLGDVVAAAGALHRREAVQGAARIAGLERQVAEATAALEAADRALGSALGTLAREGERAAGLLADAVERAMVHAELRRVCDGVAGRLDGVAALCRVPDEDAAAVRAAVLRMLQDHYTMDSERELHDLLTAPDDDRPATPARQDGGSPAADSKDALDDVFF